MLVNHPRKLVCIAVPKTGSTSLHYALLSHLGIKFETRSGAPAIYHLTATDARLIMGPFKFDAYFSFGVVRNPFDRLVSLYHDFHDERSIIRENSFDEFVLGSLEHRIGVDVHFRPQTFFLIDDGKPVVSKVYRFESGLDTILTELGERFGFSFQRVGHARQTKRGRWEDYYTNPDVVGVAERLYADDFSAFNYELLSATTEA